MARIPIAVLQKVFVKEFIRSQDSYTVGGASVDMAAWDMSQFDVFRQGIRQTRGGFDCSALRMRKVASTGKWNE